MLRSIAFASLALGPLAQAAFVMPMIGGGQVGMMGAPMLHTDIGFDGTTLTAHVDTSHGVPLLRPLTSPNEFDPAQPWAVLQNKAYNFQHAWNPAGFITLPADSGIWIERLHHDAGLESFKRPPASPAYAPLFTADGERWKWSGAMTHNVYAVLDPTEVSYQASYNVYLGDATTGEPLSGFNSVVVNWSWNATPVPEPLVLSAVAGAMLLAVRRRVR
jgi:hypothetical protein